MSIRALGLAVCLAVSALLTLALGLVLHLNLRAIDDAQQIEEVASVKAQLGAASAALSAERGLAQIALTLRTPMDETLAGQIAEIRPQVDAALAALRETVAGLETIHARAALAVEIEAVPARLAELRAVVDTEAGLTAFRRSAVAPTVVPALDALTRTVFDLGALAEPTGARIPSVVAHGLTLQRLGWEMREYANRDRTVLLIGAMARWPLDAVTVQATQAQFDRASETAASVARLALHAETTPAQRAAADAVASALLGEYGALREEMLAQASSGAFPLEAGVFLDRSDSLLAPAEALSEAGAQGAVAAARSLAAEARGNAALAGVGLGIGLVALATLMWFMLLRVSGRLVAISDLLQRLAAGDLAVDAQRFAGRDETARLAAALDVLPTNAQELERLRAAQHADRLAPQAARPPPLDAAPATLEATAAAAPAGPLAPPGGAA
ncbi:MAG: hypothetical protein ACFE0R_20080 [Salinarimonas sp.]